MIKKKYHIISAGIIATSLSVGAVPFAVPQLSADTFKADIAEIVATTADLDTSMIDSVFNGVQYVDENGDIQTITEENISHDINDVVKKYSVTNYVIGDDSDSTSIYDSLSDTYDYYIPIKNGNDIVGMARLNIGQPVDEVKKVLNSLTFNNESTKDEILQRAAAREGKWYIASVKQYDNSSIGFMTDDEIESKLSAEGITDAIDIRYISISGFADEALCVKTVDGEYIIPLDANPALTDINNGKTYTIADVQNSVGTVGVSEVE